MDFNNCLTEGTCMTESSLVFFFFKDEKKNPKFILQRFIILSRTVIVFDFSKPQQKPPNGKYATDEAS